MTTVHLAGGQLWVGETSLPLLSGEVHYWRLDPANWRPILAQVKALGLHTIATYVCWDFCELSPGHYDFTGATDPRRNLLGFLDLAADMDLWVILRPGPYIYSEWRNNGVPDDAARHHRLSAEFQARAQPYMAAVTAAAAPHLATHGGRIVLWQPDNEIDPWPHWYTEQLGLGGAPGPFQAFLREHYGTLAAFNRAWGTAYGQWEAARAVMVLTPSDPDLLRRYLDTVRFTHWYVNGVARWASETYRALGVDVPLVFNAYSGTATQRWADLEAIGDLAGPDIYPSQEFSLRANEHRSFLEAARYTRTYSRVPYIAEFEAGIWHGWHTDVGVLGPNHYRLMCLSALLAGVSGWNWYMLANRDNWYMSPINEWGRTRPDLFTVFQQIVSLWAELDPPSLTKLTSLAVTHDALQRGTVRPGQELLQALYAVGLDYEFFDVIRGAVSKPVLIYAGGHWLSAAGQTQLRAYVEAGGHLLLVGEYPRQNDELRPLNLLGVLDPPGIVSAQPDGLRLTLTLPAAEIVVDSAWAYAYGEVPGQPITATRQPHSAALMSDELVLHTDLQVGQQYVVGYRQRLGQGTLTVVGLQPTPGLLLALLRELPIALPVHARTPATTAAVFARGAERYIIVVNASASPLTAAIALAPGTLPARRCHVRDLLGGGTWQVDFDQTDSLTVALGGKDGTVLQVKPI
jgi:hypothetical protein